MTLLHTSLHTSNPLKTKNNYLIALVSVERKIHNDMIRKCSWDLHCSGGYSTE
jgi:hypothetical protein